MRRPRQLRLLSAGLISLLALLSFTYTSASSANISHSYNSDGEIMVGSLVSLNSGQTEQVEASTTQNAAKLLGVVVAKDDSLLAVDVEQGKVQIATSGTASALVSDLNGSIKVGDQIAVSPFAGIGMKAGPGMRIIGLAQTDFDPDAEGAVGKTVTDKSGKSRQIKVGFVRLNIGVGTSSSGDDSNLSGLQKVAKQLTGNTVSTWRALVSLLVAIIAIFALITLIYASIYGSIISIGRNPLAKYAVFRTLGSVLAMAAMTAGVAGLTIFLLLR